MTHSLEDDTRELLAILPLLNQIVVGAVRGELGEETTVPQFRVLAHLADAPQTLSALARQRRVSAQAMCELVQTLVERGLVVRTPNPADRRQHMLRLTPSGLAHYQRTQEHMVKRLAPLLAALSSAEIAAVRLALPALHRVLAGSEEGTPKIA